MRVDRYMYIIIEVLTRINHDTYISSPASASCANRTDQKGRKKEEKKGRLWTTDANRLQITVNLKKMRHLRRAFRRFCASSHPSYKCFMLENLTFFHNSPKTPDDADIANRKHYSAPAGALTMFKAIYRGYKLYFHLPTIVGAHLVGGIGIILRFLPGTKRYLLATRFARSAEKR